jgi:hypothetical protein
MNDEPQDQADQPSQEELRERLEEQIRGLRVQDLLVESIVSVLNLTARRIAKEDERDLEQARVGIDAVRAWVDLLPDDAAAQIRNALSELQMLYAQAAEGEHAAPEAATSSAGEAPPKDRPQQPPPGREPGRGEPPPRLWTPPGSE